MSQPLSILNEDYQLLDGPRSLHKLIKWQRDGCALDFLDAYGRRHIYTYRDLRRCVLSIVAALQETLNPLAIGSERNRRIIPVLLPQSPGLYMAILAILEVGAAFCPLNLDSPVDRIKFITEDVSAQVFITTRQYEQLVAREGGLKLIILDEYPSVQGDDEFPEPKSFDSVNLQNLAYIMYTSGSSGTPKGVAISHLAASQSLLAHDEYIPTFNRFLQFAAPSFDVSVFEIIFPLHRGATLVGCSRAQMLNDLTGVIRKLEVDTVELTPTVVISLIQKRSNVPCLQLLLTIGETLTKPVVEEFGSSEKSRGILFAMYGPTEAAIHCTINPRMKADVKPTDIGIPFSTVSTFITSTAIPSAVGTDIDLLPLGEVGELVLGGPQVTEGYLNRDEQNKTAFIMLRGQRVYRTGDKARMTTKGSIEIIGRISSGQIKLRGQRAELGEIEAAVYKHLGIKSVSASILGGILVVFVLTMGAKITPEEVLQTCSSWLPAFMVPSELVILDAFPYLPSGKVDKRKLEVDHQTLKGGPKESMDKWDTAVEEVVAQLLRDILGVEILPNAQLAALGLDSLVAIRLASALRSTGNDISPVDILKAKNIRSLAHACECSNEVSEPRCLNNVQSFKLDDLAQKWAEVMEDSIDLANVDYMMPCTPLQDAMISETATNNLAYKNQVLIELPTTSNILEAWAAIQKLAEKNPILRTGFVPFPNDNSIHSQLVWKNLLEFQYVTSDGLSLRAEVPHEISLVHPLYFHIYHYKNHIRLLISIYHGIYDAWSLELLLNDLESILSQKTVLDRPSFGKVVEYYYKDMADREEGSLKGYWMDHLSQLEISSMPNFHGLKEIRSGLQVNDLVTSITTRNLMASARSLCVSPQSLFQAAFALILSSYTGSLDTCFGSVFSGRTAPITRIEDIAGPCLATLPIRIDLATISNMSDMVRRLNSINRKHLENSALSLREIKKFCNAEPGQFLFDTLLVWQQTLHNADHKRERVILVDSTDYLEFNLTLEITPGTEYVRVRANYQQAIFPPRQIDLLLRQLEKLVEILISSPEIPLDVARKSLSHELLSIENPNPERNLTAEFVTMSIESIALECPDKLAIDFANSIGDNSIDSKQVTYKELNLNANKIAHHLLSHNVLPNDLVCICMEKSTELYISILAVMKTGAGYLPITPDTPIDRIQSIVTEARIKILITHSSLGRHLSSVRSVSILLLDELDLTAASTKSPTIRLNSEDVAYCVFTSGSTGTPKGVLVTRENLTSNLQTLAQLYPYSRNSRLLQSCSQAFDVSVFEIFFTWYIGACLCSAVKDVLFQDIERAIRALKITHLSLTPTVAALTDPKNVPGVEFLVTAGEAVTEKVFDAWAGHGLWQGYGPSETTNICTIRPNVSENDLINNIGYPLKNTSVFVLCSGNDFCLVPRGGEGEFCFGGEQIGRGYLDPTQAVGKFITHPEYGRLYRSGDYGRILPDGSLSFTGRRDDQVKLHGQRIELGEITNILLRSPEVRDSITLIVEGEGNTTRHLVCFWVPAHGSVIEFTGLVPDPSEIEKLFASLIASLPTYMIPSALLPVSSLPSTVQGKIDKRRLIKHYRSLKVDYLNQASRTEIGKTDHAWNKAESDVANSVAKIAKISVREIGPDTSFFSLGIDSVSAISLSRTLREEFNYNFGISDILKHPSVSRLAKRASLATRSNDEALHTDPGGFDFDPEFVRSTRDKFAKFGIIIESIMPCTPLQEAMLSASETSSARSYENQMMFEVKVDIQEFQATWKKIIERHEILRTCFVETDHLRHAYAQVVLQNFTPRWEIVEYSDRQSVLLDDSSKLSNLKHPEQNPPYSLKFMISQTSTKFLLSIHHALYDAWAISILFEEIEVMLRNEVLPPPVSFAPFLRYITAADRVKAGKYWEDLLHGFCPVSLSPIANSRLIKGIGATKGTVVTRLRASAKLKWIEEQVKNIKSSLLAVCQASWASVLSQRLEKDDICFGNVVSGRTIPVNGLDRLVAPCFNTIPVRLQDLHNLPFMEAFRSLQKQSIDCLPFQLIPLRAMKSNLNKEGERLFQSLIILQRPAKPLDSSIWSLTEDNGAMDIPIVIEIVPQPADDQLEFILHSHQQYLSQDAAKMMLEDFDNILRKSLDNPRHMLSSIIPNNTPQKKIGRQQANESSGPENIDRIHVMNAMESRIRDLFATFTDVPMDRIGRETSIFRLGLDSISAVQVAASLRKQRFKIMASDVLQHPNVASLAIYLSEQNGVLQVNQRMFDFDSFDRKHRPAISSKLKLSAKNIDAVRPCTSVQCGMLAQTLHADGRLYVNSLCCKLRPDVSLEKMRYAWVATMQNHEMLRTGFVEVEDDKYPFAMVTYGKEYASLPWYEGKHGISDENSIAIDSLPRNPWRIDLSKSELEAVIKFTAHHAIYDAQSLELVLSDVAKFYYSVDSDPSLESPISIKHLLSEILHISDENEIARKNFWQGDNKVAINRFPDLTPLRESGMKSLIREKHSNLSVARLEALSRSRDVSIQAAGQAAWARLLSAYTGEPSVTFGLTLSGRSILEKAEVIPFPTIVTLPVTCHITGTNAEVLDQIMRHNSLLHAHQHTPLAKIQTWSGHPEGNLFDTLFAYQKLIRTNEGVDRPWEIVQERAMADYVVSMEIQPIDRGVLQLRLTFREDLVPVEQAELILQQFDALLLDTLENREQLSSVPPKQIPKLLSVRPAEKPVLLSPVELLHVFVEMQAAKVPHKTALQFTTSLSAGKSSTQCWTYAELNREGNKIANYLLESGTKNGELIAICFHKCPQASFAILGILKAGCAYVALDPNAPSDRLKFIIEDSKSTVILTNDGALKGFDSSILVVDVGSLHGFSTNEPVLGRPINSNDTCYCLYTSGTTGTPKGCEITHENVVQAMMSFQKLFEGHWTEESKWLQFASFHFDVSVLEQFWAWSVGISVVSAPRDLIFEDIPRAIRQLGVTHIDLTPSLARLIHPDDVPSLTKGVFITGGEQLRQEILDVWGDHKCIYNGYGPTEATIGVTMFPRVPRNGKPSNIGPQFLNVGSYVFKPGTTQPVLRGAVGELCVSGKLVGKGYLNRAELTEERFPYLDEFCERVYRTGDLVRVLHDGSFLFLGRADDQVKLRGQRLELTEINEVIKKHVQGLQDVVTLVLQHAQQQKEQLVTFFVLSIDGMKGANTREVSSAMRDACKGNLPAYMVPTYFMLLDKLPLSANNKADHKQLAKYFDSLNSTELHNLSTTGKMAKKWTKEEQEVLKSLSRILNVEISSLTSGSNIFELGIDSISVIGFSRKLRKAGYRNAKLSTVMKNSSIASLVQELAFKDQNDRDLENRALAAKQNIIAFAHRNIIAVAEELNIDPSNVEYLAPCTPAQEGMIYQFLGSEEPLYFTTFSFKLDSSVDEDNLRDAWHMASRHLQVLRTRFLLVNDGCAQVVLKESPVNWISQVVGDTIEEGLEEYKNVQRDEICRMEKSTALASPWKLLLLKDEMSRILSLTIFHGLYDGISLPMMLRSVYEEYQNSIKIDYGPGFHSILPYGPLAVTEKAEGFWRAALKGWNYRAMPRLAVGKASKTVSLSKTIQNLKFLEELRQRLGVTYQAILQGAWCSVIQEYLTSEITFGLVTSGRAIDFDGAEKVIGPLLNTVPFHLVIAAEMNWEGLIRACHEFNMQLLPYQHTPLKDIQKWCGAGKPLFDTLFVFQQEDDNDLDMEGFWREIPTEPVADYPLALETELKADGSVVLTIVGQRNIIDKDAASRFLFKLENALRALQSPGQNIPRFAVSAIEEVSNAAGDKTVTRSGNGERQVFEWSPEAEILRTEIESLAGASGINENNSIFELGLDSIDVIRLVSRLKKRGVHISVSSILRSQTIAVMATQISSTTWLHSMAGRPIRNYEDTLLSTLRAAQRLPADVETLLPVTPLQEGMVAEMIASGYVRYFNHEIFQVPNHVDINKLKLAWDAVISKNPILRTRFVEIDDVELPMSFAQVVCKARETYWRTFTLSRSSDLQAAFEEVIGIHIQGVKRGIMLHLHHIDHGGDAYVVLSIAHALYDGWSLQALHEDIWKAYHNQVVSRPDPKQMIDLISNNDGPEATKFWKASLGGLQKFKFPHAKHNNIEEKVAVYRQEQPSRHSLDMIQSFCKSMSISLQALGQTCWAILLATYLNRLDVVFGVVLSCRDTEEASEIMFPLMNTVAVRSVIHGSVMEMLRYMQERGNSIRQYQHFPLRKARALAGVNSGNIFDTLFIYQGRARIVLSEEDKLYHSIRSVSEVEFPVCVEMEIVNDILVWRAACQDSVLSLTGTEHLLNGLDDVLGNMMQNPDMQTILSNSDGISICGMPAFQNETSARTLVNEDISKTKIPVSSTTWTESDMIIRRVLSLVSKVPEEQISKDQTIFHIGLDSISAIKVSSILKSEGIKLSVSDITKNDIGSMADYISSLSIPSAETDQDISRSLATAIEDVDIASVIHNAQLDRADIEEVLPVTAGQLYMLMRWEFSEGTLFVSTFKCRIIGQLEKARFDKAWKELTKLHPILRTVFVIIEDSRTHAVQLVRKEANINIQWSSLSPPHLHNKITLASPIRLIVEQHENKSVLHLHIHHAIYDGISLPLLLRDLQTMYAAPQAGLSVRSRWRDFVARSVDQQQGRVESQFKFWTSYLRKPTLLRRKDTKESAIVNSVEVFEPDCRIGNIARLGQNAGVSVDAILLAAFSKVYSGLLSCEGEGHTPSIESTNHVKEVVFGLYLANRAPYGEDLSSLAAPTLNLLPIQVDATKTMIDIAKTIQSDLQRLSSIDIVGTSLAQIYDWTGVSINCFVNILKQPSTDVDVDAFSFPGLSLSLEQCGDDTRRRRAGIVETQKEHQIRNNEVDESNRRFREVYLPSVDVEMRIISTGDETGLDIGVFAPCEYLDVDEARDLMEKMKLQLNSLG